MNQVNRIIPHIIEQHAEEASFLWLLRRAAVHAPHYDLKDLVTLDERVEAHLDGLRIAGEEGWEVCLGNLATQEPGELFAAGVLALEGNDFSRLEELYRIAEEAPKAMTGLISALGWVEAHCLRGKVNGLLVSKSPLWRWVGISACAIHRIDPGKYLDEAILDDDPHLRARALRTVGELGKQDMKPLVLRSIGHDDHASCFWAAWSAVLIGDRGKAVEFLQTEIIQGSDDRREAMELILRIADLQHVKRLLGDLAQRPDTLRKAIIGAGISGDAAYIPWLIKQMEAPEYARPAGESFSMITGVDIAYEDLEGECPEDFEAGPTENPEDEDVALDEDEDLPWPDTEQVQQWWNRRQDAFKPGVRHLLGKPMSETHCLAVLKDGMQRQRRAAALELALTQPKKPLFEIRSVGKKQQQLLSQVP